MIGEATATPRYDGGSTIDAELLTRGQTKAHDEWISAIEAESARARLVSVADPILCPIWWCCALCPLLLLLRCVAVLEGKEGFLR